MAFITGTNSQGAWKLVDQHGLGVNEGTTVKDHRGDTEIIVGGTPPHGPGKSGYVETQAGGRFYAHVFDLKWMKEA